VIELSRNCDIREGVAAQIHIYVMDIWPIVKSSIMKIELKSFHFYM